MVNKEKLEEYFKVLEQQDSDTFMQMVDQYLDDEAVDMMADLVADFYGLEDDDEVGQLTQIMIMGYIAGKLS